MIAFTVIGTPAPKGSKTAVVRNGRAVLLDARRGPARENYASWKVAVAREAANAMQGFPPLDGPLALAVTFWLRPPQHETRAERLRDHHAVKPDASKLLRAIEDPMTGIVIADDARIAVLHIAKRYARDRMPGADVTVTRLGDCP